jgi:hypothetical protein
MNGVDTRHGFQTRPTFIGRMAMFVNAMVLPYRNPLVGDRQG